MKHKKIDKKLFLNKETIAHLHHREMKVVKGGISGIPACISCIDPCVWTGRSACFCVITDGCASRDHA
jgi:natural product precursor